MPKVESRRHQQRHYRWRQLQVFCVGGYQFVAAAIVLSFGYVFRRAWYKNRVVLFLSALWTLFIVVMTVVPSSFSCIWRVNCNNEVSMTMMSKALTFTCRLHLLTYSHPQQDAVRYVTSSAPVAINNPFNTTVMPVQFRWLLVCIMAMNLVAMIARYDCCDGYLLGARLNSMSYSLSSLSTGNAVSLTDT
jgi:hypothetical protein